MSDASLESIIQNSGFCHVVMHHPIVYTHFLRFIETKWLDLRTFSVLRLLRAAYACVMRRRTTFSRSLPMAGYFVPNVGLFVSVLGRPVDTGSYSRMEADARRINEERKRLLSESKDLCSQVWITMFCFVEWACFAVEAIVFAQDKNSVQELVEYPTSVYLSCNL